MSNRALALFAAALVACSGSSSSSTGSSGSESSSGGSSGANSETSSDAGTSSESSAREERDAASSVNGASGASSGTASSSASTPPPSHASTTAPSTAPAQPAAPARNFPPPPTYVQAQGVLRNSPQTARCFTHLINADLNDAYVDADFDGDGKPERIFQLPDCLIVTTQGAEHWEFPAQLSRPVPREMDSVALRAVQRGGGLAIEVRDSRDEPRTRETHYFRWNGRELTETP